MAVATCALGNFFCRLNLPAMALAVIKDKAKTLMPFTLSQV
jgi:hypothetical protein